MLFCYFEAWLYFSNFLFVCFLYRYPLHCHDWDCLLLITVIVSARPQIWCVLGQIVSPDWITEEGELTGGGQSLPVIQ